MCGSCRIIVRGGGLFGLDGAKVVTAAVSAPMVHKVAMSERLLKVLAGFRLETASAILLTLWFAAAACAWAG